MTDRSLIAQEKEINLHQNNETYTAVYKNTLNRRISVFLIDGLLERYDAITPKQRGQKVSAAAFMAECLERHVTEMEEQNNASQY